MVGGVQRALRGGARGLKESGCPNPKGAKIATGKLSLKEVGLGGFCTSTQPPQFAKCAASDTSSLLCQRLLHCVATGKCTSGALCSNTSPLGWALGFNKGTYRLCLLGLGRLVPCLGLAVANAASSSELLSRGLQFWWTLQRGKSSSVLLASLRRGSSSSLLLVSATCLRCCGVPPNDNNNSLFLSVSCSASTQRFRWYIAGFALLQSNCCSHKLVHGHPTLHRCTKSSTSAVQSVYCTLKAVSDCFSPAASNAKWSAGSMHVKVPEYLVSGDALAECDQ